ncbi:hypothetical protein [Streptomyces sp. NPDC054863]
MGRSRFSGSREINEELIPCFWILAKYMRPIRAVMRERRVAFNVNSMGRRAAQTRGADFCDF